MEFLQAFNICKSGLEAQRAKMDVIISNLANIHTTSTPEGGPYKRKVIVFGSEPLSGNFDYNLKEAIQKVKVKEVVEAEDAVRKVFDPAHPDADGQGFVLMPDINTMTEMADMIITSRAYEACVTAFDAAKNMALKTLEIGK